MQQLAPSPSQRGCPSHGLVSLWDMYKLEAKLFVELISSIENIIVMMENIRSDRSQTIARIILDDAHEAEPLTQVATFNLECIKVLCTSLRCDQSAMFADEVAEELARQDCSLGKAIQRFRDLIGSVRRELATEFIYVTDRQYSRFVEPDEEIKGVLDRRYDRSIFDFREAGKCLAFGRPTACVLHLMRALEAPLADFASELDITVGEKDTWGSILDKCRIELRVRDEGKSRKWASASERRFFHDAAASLRHIQIALRDPSFHAIKEKYTPEEARLEYENIRKFLIQMDQKLSSSSEGQAS